jgi:hypothetical protein
LTNRHVRFTSTARKQVQREKEWWQSNREHVEVFAEELEQGLKIVAILPGVGTPYARSPVAGVRRVYLRRVGAHLYYPFDDREVIIRAFWGARRGLGPKLGR